MYPVAITVEAKLRRLVESNPILNTISEGSETDLSIICEVTPVQDDTETQSSQISSSKKTM